MKSPSLLLLSLFVCLNASAAKPHANKTQAKPQAKLNLDAPEYYQDIVAPSGTTKIAVMAKEAILIDYDSGRVLLEKHADERMVPSSMTKMLTSYVIIDRIKKGNLSLDTSFLVSENAWRTQGSKTFVPLGQQVKVDDLLRGIIVQSGNDACIVAAEGISGGEVQFASEMNSAAAKLGMAHSHFTNSSGLFEPDHYSTARDLAKLSVAVIKDHPDFYKYYQEKDFTYNNIKQGNRNPLLYDNMGCDGIKTGHTDEGGFGVAASCVDGGARYILVINGLPSVQARADEARKLMNWAKQNFVRKTVAKKGDIIQDVSVKNGVKQEIKALAQKDVSLLVLRAQQDQVKSKVVVANQILAPIKAGQVVGKIVVSAPDLTNEVALVANESSEKLGFFKRALRFIGMDV